MSKRVLCTLVLSAALLAGKDSGFAGKWVLDKGASTATCDLPDNLRQEIKRKGDGYTIETSWREPRSGIAPLALLGIMAAQLRLETGGAETTNHIGPFMQRSKTAENGNELTTEWNALVNGESVQGNWKRTLSEDGKVLTLEIQQSTADGKSGSGRLVFRRK